MGKLLLVIFVAFLDLSLVLRLVVFAQDADSAKTIKFKSFTPVPTRTPIPRPTWTPIPTGISTTLTPVVNPTRKKKSPTPTVDPSACAYLGLKVNGDQPRYLGRTLCERGNFWPPFPADFVPRNLVNLDKALGGKFWIRVKSIKARKEIVGNIEKILKAMKKYSCTPFVGYVYRSYQEQKALYDGKGCTPGVVCGVAPPGKSTHQAGIAADLFCMGLDANNKAVLKSVPKEIITNSKSYGFIHPVSWDTPHFVGL